MKHRSDSKGKRPARRIPPLTPKPIGIHLKKSLKALDDLVDAGALVAISISYFDARDDLTGVLIADPETLKVASTMMSPGVMLFEASRVSGEGAEA